MFFPPASQNLERLFWNGHIAVPATLGIAHVDPMTGAIYVPGLQSKPFTKTQTHAVDRVEKNAVAQLTHLIDHPYSLAPRQHIGERSDSRWLDDLDPFPLLVQYVAEEEL